MCVRLRVLVVLKKEFVLNTLSVFCKLLFIMQIPCAVLYFHLCLNSFCRVFYGISDTGVFQERNVLLDF